MATESRPAACVSRRRVASTAAWTAPALLISAAAPAVASSSSASAPCVPGGPGGFSLERQIEYPYFGYEDWEPEADRLLRFAGTLRVTSLTGTAENVPAGQVVMFAKVAVRREYQDVVWRPEKASQSPSWKFLGLGEEFLDDDGVPFVYHNFQFDGFLTNEPGMGDDSSAFSFISNPRFRRILDPDQGDESISFNTTISATAEQRVQQCDPSGQSTLIYKTLTRHYNDETELIIDGYLSDSFDSGRQARHSPPVSQAGKRQTSAPGHR